MAEINNIIISRIFSSHAKKSGYHQLANWIKNAHVLTNDLNHDEKVLSYRLDRKLSAVLADAIGKNPAYDTESFKKEMMALKFFKNMKLIHYLYAEADVGFLPIMFPNKISIGTFHHVPEKLAGILDTKPVLKRLRGAICVGINQVEVLRNAGIMNVMYIPHGIDKGYWHPVEGEIRNNMGISVGSYFRDFNLLIDIADAIKQRRPDFVLEVVIPESRIAKIRHSDSVVFLSNLSDEELRFRYSTSAFHLLTMTDATANNALLESMACGCPILASDLPSINEYLDPAFSFSCSNNQIDRWIDSAVIFLDQHSQNNILRKNAEQVSNKYGWDRIALKVEEFYLSLMNWNNS